MRAGARRDRRRGWWAILPGLVVVLLLLGAAPIIVHEPSRASSPLANPPTPQTSLALSPSNLRNVTLSSVKNFSPAIQVSPLFYGVNIRSDQPFTVSDALELADTSTLTWRFPGGNIAESYDFLTNVDQTNGKLEKNGISNFAGLCVRVGCRAILQLPAEINNSSTDADYVSYVEHYLNFTVNGTTHEGFTPALWEFGNEPSLWTNFNQSWPHWGTPGTNATPTSYAQIVPSIVAAIRSVDPSTPIDPLGGVGGPPSGNWPWIRDAMLAAQTTAQFLSIHSYFGGGQKSSNASFYSPLYSGSELLDQVISNVTSAILKACPACTNVRLLISEEGASTAQTNSAYETGFPMDMWDAADLIQSSVANVTSLDIFAYLNSYPGSFETTAGSFDPAYYLFKDITPFLGSTVLNLTLNSTDGGKLVVGGWWGVDDNWSLLMVNLDTQNNLTVTLAGSGFPVQGNIESYTWNGTTAEPVGNASTWMNATTLTPNSLELITVSPPAAVTTPLAPTGVFVTAYNGTQARVTYVQPPGPVVNDSVTFGTPVSVAPYCDPLGVVSAGNATAGLIVTGLDPVDSHCFAAQAWTVAGAGPLSNYVNLSTKYPPPTSFGVVKVTVSSITLSWSRVSSTVNVTVYRADDLNGTCGNYTNASSAGTNSGFIAKSLGPGHAYCFEVTQWYTKALQSGPAGPLVATTLPDAPTSPRATSTSTTSIRVEWSNPMGLLNDNYVFWQAGNSCTSATKINLGGVDTSYNLTGLTPGNQYCFYIESVDAGGHSAASPIATNVTDQAPQVPSNVVFRTPTTTTINLTWTNPGGGGLVNDTILVGPASCTYNRSISLGIAGSSATVPGLAPATTYCFAVQAWNSTGPSELSGPVDGTTLPVSPSGLTILVVNVTTIALSWTNPGGSLTDDYLFWQAGGSCSSPEGVDLGSVQTAYNLTGLSSATEYCLYVEAVSAGGASAPSTSVSGTTFPSAPSALQATGETSTSITLSWSNPPGTLTDDYLYWQGGPSCGSAVPIDLQGVASTFTMGNLTEGSRYCFYVEAASAGGISAPSGILNASTGFLPAAPTSLAATNPTGSSIALTWSNPTGGGLVNDTIYYGTACTSLTASVSTDGAVARYSVTRLAPNTSYCFAVQAWNETGGSPWSVAAVGLTGAAIPATYEVTFTESGLPAGSIWWVNTTRSLSTRSNSDALSFVATNGSFSYRLATAVQTFAGPGGMFTVNGANVSEGVVFSPVTFLVSFGETGLPSGTNWSVTLDSHTESSVGPTIAFFEQNASYSYSIRTVPGFTSNRTTGTLLVAGASAKVVVAFVPTVSPPPPSNSSPGSNYLEWGVVFGEVAALVIGLLLIRAYHARKARGGPPPSRGR